ncbi:Ppx/GppA phosphatase family protein [Sphingomonas sp. SUN039]|uniref:Ppx/GppA phosphatase family protein n=1 Tax=Sphingomonas sp. SUN039 TaxID=2937787 RepID=UPI0038D39301
MMADAGSAAPAASGAGHRNSQGAWHPRRTYAALDLGTNNCRLLIARPSGEDGFVIVDAFSRIVRLGEGLAASGRLSDAAIERAVAALSICADKLVRRGVHLSRAVATEACRRAENGREFVDRVYRETGIALDIIDPGEEARLAVQGCHALLEPGDGPALIFDIGGGSTELVELLPGAGPPQIADWISVPWGVVSLAESEPQGVGDRDARIATYERMKGRVAEALGALDLPEGELRLLGTSGTVTTLASVFLELPSYDRRAVDGLHVPVGDMRRIGRDLAAMSIAERAQVACIGTERADLVVAGCAILEAILDLWPAPRVGVADRGIREGILRALMAGAVR